MSGILQNYCGWVNKNIPALLLLAGILMLPTASRADEQAHNVEQLISRAIILRLAEQPAWLNLLHYKKTLGGGLLSQADDKRFFLAEKGATDAQAELVADLRAFFLPPGASHAQCRFPARLYWLKRELNFERRLPEQSCEEYEQWKQRFDNSTLTLLFPSMYLNNPASMFGHTFLRFDTSGQNVLLNQTLSYAAFHDESDNFAVYAWKGITGGYNGRFLMQPYYETLQKYSDIEQRDVWEYSLNLSQVETTQLVRHLWEVKGIRFEYFFMRENCSYRLLALLDVAREGINMSIDSHPLYAAPVDVVRDVEQAGLIAERHYRPAKQNKITQMMQQLDDEAGRLAMQVASGSLTPAELPANMDRISRARVLRLANELVGGLESTDNSALQFSILSELSSLGLKNEQTEFIFTGEAPEQSHASARAQFSLGELEQREYVELGIRPVFHDSLDAPRGFVRGASVTVLDARLRQYQDEDRVRLQYLNLFSLRSLLPVHAWDNSSSRKLSFEVIRRQVSSASSLRVFKTEAGLGYSMEAGNSLLYGLLDGRLDYATELEDNHGFYLGGEIGALYYLEGKQWSAQFELNAQALQSVSGERGDLRLQSVGIQLNMNPDHAFRLDYRHSDDQFLEMDEARLSYLFYF